MTDIPAGLKENGLGGTFTTHFITAAPTADNKETQKCVVFDSLGFLKIVSTVTKDKETAQESEEIIYKFETDIVKTSIQIEYNKKNLIAFLGVDHTTIKLLDMQHKNLIDLVSSTSKNLFKSPVKQLQWHPLSADRTLVILLEDSTLLQYDILEDKVFRMDAETFNFKSESYMLESHFNYRDVSQYDFLESVNSFTFGKNGLKLYLTVAEDNDVYCIYPFFPYFEKTVVLAQELATELFNESYVMYEQYMEDPSVNVNTKNCLIKQLKFASKHFFSKDYDPEDVEAKPGNNNGSNSNVTIDIPFSYRSEYGVQGPFLLSPYPDSLYNKQLERITTLDVGNGNEFLVLLISDGSVLICFEDLTTPMYWSSVDPETSNSLLSSFNCSLVGLEMRHVLYDHLSQNDFGSQSCLTIVNSLPHRLILFITNRLPNNRSKNETVTAIVLDTISWSHDLSKALKESDSLVNLEGLKSRFQRLENVTSCAFVNKESLVFTTLSPSQLEVLKLQRPAEVDSDDGNELSKKFVNKFISSNTPKNKEAKYEYVLTPSIETLLKELQSLAIDLQERQTKSLYGTVTQVSTDYQSTPLKEISDNAEAVYSVITYLNKEITERLYLINNYGFKMHTLLQKQDFEFRNQIATASDLKKLTDKIQTRKTAHQERYEFLLQKHKQYMAKTESLKEKLESGLEQVSGKYLDDAISSSEKEWFLSLRKSILQFNEMVLQQQRYTEQLEYLKSALGEIKKESLENENVELNFAELQKLLTLDKDIIENCNDQVLSAAKELETKLKV
ncbi:hypothetical protein ACO0QE_004063 [Hanseniaspora vineae]